jgi:hypothetical protein
MLSKCFNPACDKELLYLRNGRVICTTNLSEDGTLAIEHFWLCGSCYLSYNFVVSGGGAVTLGPRTRMFTVERRLQTHDDQTPNPHRLRRTGIEIVHRPTNGAA